MFSTPRQKFSETCIAECLPSFKAYAQADLSKALLVLDSNKVCGSMWTDADGKLRAIVDLIARLDSGAVDYVLVNGSNEVLFPLNIGPQLLSWFLVSIARRALPSW